MKRKAQQSLEFMVTYGWMILVAGMVAGSMAYFGVFDTDQNLPAQCNLGFDFSCEQFVLFDNGTVRVEAGNKAGEPLEVESFKCTYPDESVESTAYGGAEWLPGDTFDLACNPTTGGGLTAGQREKVKVKLEYRKTGGGFTKHVEGDVAADVAESS
ncbi:hypothetical protein KY327_02160 [Candidatus Woesearchaeota archaeon]|nr:hypothetical protein [Candidatus Woesearchaeota archaeon]